VYDDELKKLVEREMLLDDMTAKLKKNGKGGVLEELAEAAGKFAEKALRDMKKTRGITSEDDFKLLLQGQGLTAAGLRRQLERHFMAAEYVRNVAFSKVNLITLSQARDYYDETPQEFQTEDAVKWQDVFVAAERFPSRQAARQHAEAVRARAARG